MDYTWNFDVEEGVSNNRIREQFKKISLSALSQIA